MSYVQKQSIRGYRTEVTDTINTTVDHTLKMLRSEDTHYYQVMLMLNVLWSK